MWLPSSGVEYIAKKSSNSLYYRIKLGPNKAPIPVIKKTNTPVVQGNIKDIRLFAIYGAEDIIVVTVSSKGRTKVLSKLTGQKGEKIRGFELMSVGLDYAIFDKNAKSYRIELSKAKIDSKGMGFTPSKTPPKSTKKSKATGDIVDAGDHKIIDKSLIEHFATNLSEINKNIGIKEIKDKDGFKGFGISFIRRGSPFAKLGIKRGDVIKTVNGQKIDSYDSAFGIYKNISNITNLTMVIERNNKEMELEYEVN